MIRKLYHLTICLMTISSIYGQAILDLSANSKDSKIKIKGTYLSIDTTGLNMIISEDPGVFYNEPDQSVLAIAQKQISIEEYESVIGMMLNFDSIYMEEKVVFQDFSGKLYLGRMNIQNSDKDTWICYLGNDEVVLEIRGFYNSDLKSKYKAQFEQAIKSLYIEVDENLSIYDDLPYYLDEIRFPYIKQFALMPQSISISREIEGHIRTVVLMYYKVSNEDLESFKSEYEAGAERKIIGDKEIIMNIAEDEGKVKVQGLIISGNQVILINCISSTTDAEALNEFHAMAESIFFRDKE